MSALTVYQGLEECFRRIAGLRGVNLGFRTGDLDLPAIYVVYQQFDRPVRSSPPAANKTTMQHTFLAVLVIRFVDYDAAEMELVTLLDAIPDAIDADPRLGGRLGGGYCACSSGVAGFATIGDVQYRIVEFTIEAKDSREGSR